MNTSKTIVSSKNKLILEYKQSLINAAFVQQGLLPKDRHFSKLFKEHFVLYQPQSTVGGDFYWVGSKHNLKYLAVGDCTGHGVSASLLSVLALNLLEYSIMNKGLKKPSKILQEIDKKFIESFKDVESNHFDNPWIDISILCIDEEKKRITYSSANRKILHISNAKPTIYKGCRYPIGGWQIEECRKFNCHHFNYQTNDKIYIGSDGYQDQIGGKNNKKYKAKNLHKFLLDHSSNNFTQQKNDLVKEFKKWKHINEQLDDICIVGVEL